jgi:hypothetical protein
VVIGKRALREIPPATAGHQAPSVPPGFSNSGLPKRSRQHFLSRPRQKMLAAVGDRFGGFEWDQGDGMD